jgi:CheY-like chemotaxis protein
MNLAVMSQDENRPIRSCEKQEKNGLHSRADRSPIKILLVDDCTDGRELLARYLGHEFIADITQVSSGNEAIRLLSQNDFDLVISDLSMDDGDGLAVWMFIEANDRIKTRFIMFTGSMEFAASARLDERMIVIAKPKIDELVDAIAFLGIIDADRSGEG